MSVCVYTCTTKIMNNLLYSMYILIYIKVKTYLLPAVPVYCNNELTAHRESKRSTLRVLPQADPLGPYARHPCAKERSERGHDEVCIRRRKETKKGKR